MRKILFLLVSVLLLNSCAFIGRNDVSGTKYTHEKIQKAYVLVQTDLQSSFGPNLEKHLHEQLLEEGIENKVYLKKELDLLTDEEILDDIKDYKATHLINFSLTNKKVKFHNDGSGSTYIWYAAEIKNLINGSTTWEGEIYMVVSMGGKLQTKRLVTKFIRKLKEDEVI